VDYTARELSKVKRIAGGILVLCALAFPGSALAEPTAARTHSTDPMDWIIQHVCAGAGDEPVSADPYDGCPAGTHERRLKLGDPLPYYRHDQPGGKNNHPFGYQRHDAYPLIDRHYGGVISANDYDFDYFEPYGVMHPGDGDGFDVYRAANGYVTGGGTRDGSGYSQTFFGPDCKPFGGWVFFPASFLTSLRPGAEGRGVFPIRGDYWEQRGEAWPGRCEPGKGFSNTTLTTWSFEPGHVFGGLNGARQKKLDAIVSTHGLPSPFKSQAHYHLERIYFTDLYGPTRWESWADARESRPPAKACGGPAQMTYEGVEFTLTDCRDWSLTEIIDPPQPHAPWPYPETNILADWHFINATLSPWHIDGGAMKISMMNSKTAPDVRFAHDAPGVRYLHINCAEGANDCGGSLYQDVPLKGLPAAKSYDYGFSGAIAGEGEGLIDVSLSQRDAQGRSLWETKFTARVINSYRNKTVASSVYNASSVFLTTTPPFDLKPGAVALRLTLSPKTPQQYDILDSWLMPR
jgi:hypothetical protein